VPPPRSGRARLRSPPRSTSHTPTSGISIEAGNKVVFWYFSGNREERAFENPDTFDILRHPNRHLAFGAGGPHFCMGAALGRQVMKAALRELGGMGTALEMEAYLHGALQPTASEYDVLVQALNERFVQTRRRSFGAVLNRSNW
jgi:hypothetical protein